MTTSLKGKSVLVTGGSGGIGGAIAQAFGKTGASVTVAYHSDEEGAEETAKAIRDAGSKAIIAKANVSDAASVAGLFAAHDEAFGGLDICINNAGIDGERGNLWELDADDIMKVLDINLRGGIFTSREALKRMVPAKSGVLLSITSVHEQVPWGGHAAYCSSKAAIGMMTRSLALEASPHGVRVVCLAPGAIRTDINKDMWSDPEQLADLEKKVPLGRIGETPEVAGLAVALCSDTASYVTGTTIYADGGMTAYPSFAEGG